MIVNTPKKDNTPEADTEDDDALRLGKTLGGARGNALLAVTTFCQKDIGLLQKRAEFMTFIGVKPLHDLLLIGDSDVSGVQLAEAAKLHQPLFRNVTTRQIKNSQSNEGWPRNCNKAFRNTIWLVHGMFKPKFENRPYRGWFYFESDITPLIPDFLVKMEQEYNQFRKPLMGVVGSITADDGRPIRHMNGAAIYPFGMQHYGEQLMLVDNLPWDVAGLSGNKLRDVHDMTHAKYSMHFSTFEYRPVSAGRFKATKRPHGKAAFEVDVDTNGHWIHHGCKDGTLIQILMGKQDADPLPDIDPIAIALQARAEALAAMPLPPKEDPFFGKPKRRAKKTVNKVKKKPAKKDTSRSSTGNEGEIREALKTMKWRDILKKYKLSARQLAAIRDGK